MLDSERLWRDSRPGRIRGTSRGLAPGFVQCNLAILPKAFGFDFLLYCQRNQRACPVLEVTDPGDPVPRRLAPSADLRTDCARYSVFVDGARQDDRSDLTDIWRDDLLCFLIGSGITFDAALERAGVPTGSGRWVLRTALPTEPAGPFRGNLIVTMRWLTPGQAITATQVTARFPFNHGAPIHIGHPAAIGAAPVSLTRGAGDPYRRPRRDRRRPRQPHVRRPGAGPAARPGAGLLGRRGHAASGLRGGPPRPGPR